MAVMLSLVEYVVHEVGQEIRKINQIQIYQKIDIELEKMEVFY